MIQCVCRNISDRDFTDVAELNKRLLEDDAVCGTCQQDLELEADLQSSQEV